MSCFTMSGQLAELNSPLWCLSIQTQPSCQKDGPLAAVEACWWFEVIVVMTMHV